jgi:hypothetical protein
MAPHQSVSFCLVILHISQYRLRGCANLNSHQGSILTWPEAKPWVQVYRAAPARQRALSVLPLLLLLSLLLLC